MIKLVKEVTKVKRDENPTPQQVQKNDDRQGTADCDKSCSSEFCKTVEFIAEEALETLAVCLGYNFFE
jgi:hypothetical protein